MRRPLVVAALLLLVAVLAHATVTSATRTVSYSGTGLVSTYAVPFPFQLSSHLRLTRTASGTGTVLVLTTDYTVTGAGKSTGGSITLQTALPVDSTLLIERVVPYTQTTSFATQGTFSPTLHEKAFDKLTQGQQQLSAEATSIRTDYAAADTALRADFAANPDATVLDARTVQSTGSTTARTLAARFGEVKHASDFGALCNGSANDTTAIQAAITAAKALAGGGTVRLPRGTCMITNLNLTHINLSFNGWFTMEGDGEYSTTLQQIASTGGNVMDVSGSTQVTFRNFRIVTGAGAKIGILISRLATGTNANKQYYSHIRVIGGATQALVAIMGGEETYWENVVLTHQGTSGDSALYVGAYNDKYLVTPDAGSTELGLGATSAYGTILEGQSTIDNHFIRSNFSSSFTGKDIIHIHGSAGAEFDGCSTYYTGGSGNLRAHVFVDTHPPDVVSGQWPVVFTNNLFEGAGDIFVFAETAPNANYVDWKITHNWASVSGYKWMVNTGTAVVQDGLVFENNNASGGFAVEIAQATRSTISNFEEGSSVTVGGFCGGCEIKAISTGLTFPASKNHGSIVKLMDVYQAGEGIHRDEYGGGAGIASRLLRIRPLTGAPAAAQLAVGELMAADQTTWNPLGRVHTEPYLVWYDGVKYQLAGQQVLYGSATWNPGDLADAAAESTSVTVTGALVGDKVAVSFSLALPAGYTMTGGVSASDTVSVTAFNKSGGNLNLASGTVRAEVTRF